MFAPREGNAPSLTPSLLLIALFVSFPWLGIASYATLMNRWRELNPLMCELKLPIRLTAYQRSLSRHEQNTKNMAT